MVKPKSKKQTSSQEAVNSGILSGRYVPTEDKIGERIKEARERIKFNFEELARLTALYDHPDYKKGLTPAMLARYEKGVDGRPVLPGARELRILCESLGVSADWLLLGVNHKDIYQHAGEVAQRLNALLSAAENYKMFGQDYMDPALGAGFARDQKLHRAKFPSDYPEESS